MNYKLDDKKNYALFSSPVIFSTFAPYNLRQLKKDIIGSYKGLSPDRIYALIKGIGRVENMFSVNIQSTQSKLIKGMLGL